MKILRIALGIYFAWYLLKGLEVLLRSTSADRILFGSAGFSWLFWILMPLVLLGNVACLLYVIRLEGAFFIPALAGVGVGFLQTAVAAAIGYFNPALMKGAVMVSREARGLSVRPEMIEMLDNPMTSLMPAVFSAVFGIVLVVLLFVVKKGTTKKRAWVG